MNRDMGSRDPAFTTVTRQIREILVALVDGGSRYAAVPCQGSGTFSVEAMIGTLVPRDGALLVLVNGAYGRRIAEIARALGRTTHVLDEDEARPVDADRVDAWLAAHPGVGHVAIVHCETTTGLLNPVEAVATVVARHGRELLIDSMSALGALPLSAAHIPFQAVVSSANKCLEGVPGFAFAVVRRDALAAATGNARGVSLDLAAQHARFERDGQWRFTPPTHSLLAFRAALEAWRDEGGQPGRLARYRANCDRLVGGLRALGLHTLLPDALQAPVIVTFLTPPHPDWDFERFYDALVARGFAIYPGKLTARPTFRVGCIGHVFPADMARFVGAVGEALEAMGIHPDGGPP